MKNYQLLLVEDDESLGYLLSEYLNFKNFVVKWVKNGNHALTILKTQTFDLCLLDVMMPDMDGFKLAELMKREGINIPFLFLTARALKIDVLKGFSLGAVDYIRKPIDEEELVVRLNSLLGILSYTEKKSETTEYQIGNYIFYPTHFELKYGKEVNQLTSRENELLLYLIENKNNVCHHDEILNKFWGETNTLNRKSLNVFITRLRKYFSKDPSISIENIHNQGFKFIYPE